MNPTRPKRLFLQLFIHKLTRAYEIREHQRNLLATGACAVIGAVPLPGLARASALGGPDLTNEEIIRKWYAAWEKKDLATFNMLLADNFTFTSALRRHNTALTPALRPFV